MQNHETDAYKTIKKHSQGLYKDKGSKFIALAYPVMDEEEIRSLLEMVKKEYHDARHHCYAWILDHNDRRYRFNDDGEPSGTAGKPIYGQLLAHDLCNVLIIVVRYFGGTKLGVRGLINAYKGAARDAVANNRMIEKTIRDHYMVSFNYSAMNEVMRIMKEFDLPQYDHAFDLRCTLRFSVRKSLSKQVIQQLETIQTASVSFLYSR